MIVTKDPLTGAYNLELLKIGLVLPIISLVSAIKSFVLLIIILQSPTQA